MGMKSGAESNQAPTKIHGFVKSMDGGTLVLTDGRRFSLSGAKIINKLSPKRPAGRAIVEMTFVNNNLVQVFLY